MSSIIRTLVVDVVDALTTTTNLVKQLLLVTIHSEVVLLRVIYKPILFLVIRRVSFIVVVILERQS